MSPNQKYPLSHQMSWSRNSGKKSHTPQGLERTIKRFLSKKYGRPTKKLPSKQKEKSIRMNIDLR
jgi:hypothetical protein